MNISLYDILSKDFIFHTRFFFFFFLLFTAPIYISYTTKHKYSLKDGYFFTVAPGYYKPNEFGIRLKNVFEVVNSDRKGFLEIRATSLVPFETKLIDKTMLSLNEVS